MHDQFDDKLSGRIRDVFDNFEDGSADMGWAELRKKFPGEQKTKHLAGWWWQSAAVLLMALGTWAYFSQSPEKIYLTGKIKTESLPTQKDMLEGTTAVMNGTSDAQALERIKTEDAAPIYAVKKPFVGIKKHFRNTEVPKSHNVAPISTAAINTTDPTDIQTIKEEESRIVSIAPTENVDSAKVIVKQDKINALEKMLVQDLLATRPTKKIKKPASLEDIAPDEEKVAQLSNPKNDRKIKIGILANSYMNYAKGSEGSINTGVGISSDIPIGKKLKISTGIALAQNTLKFESKIPVTATASVNSAIAMKEDAMPVDKNNPGFANLTNYNPATYSFNNYNASLLGLDLPVNLKFSVFKKKNELYFSAGLSSNFYIEENYSYSYQRNIGSISTTQQEDDNDGKSKFQNFDFARMLNFSVGFEQPISKQSQLSFEPFIKYPLGGQGARDIRFGSVGMNLKLNISKSAGKQ